MDVEKSLEMWRGTNDMDWKTETPLLFWLFVAMGYVRSLVQLWFIDRAILLKENTPKKQVLLGAALNNRIGEIHSLEIDWYDLFACAKLTVCTM